MGLPAPEAVRQADLAPAGTTGVRLWDEVRKLATVNERLTGLDNEEARLQAQILEISRTVFDLAKEVRELSGLMKGFEKRLDDPDKIVETSIRLRVMEEVEKLRSEIRSSSGG